MAEVLHGATHTLVELHLGTPAQNPFGQADVEAGPFQVTTTAYHASGLPGRRRHNRPGAAELDRTGHQPGGAAIAGLAGAVTRAARDPVLAPAFGVAERNRKRPQCYRIGSRGRTGCRLESRERLRTMIAPRSGWLKQAQHSEHCREGGRDECEIFCVAMCFRIRVGLDRRVIARPRRLRL